MNPLLSKMSRYFRFPQRGRGRAGISHGNAWRPSTCLEMPEERMVPASFSIADATMNEIGTLSAFITAGSGGLSAPEGITLGPDGNVYVAGNGDAVVRTLPHERFVR